MLSGQPLAGFVDGDREVALFNRPVSIFRDPKGFFIVADQNNHSIRKISPLGMHIVNFFN